jgi:GNAT superfamily N-acetyltransferase
MNNITIRPLIKEDVDVLLNLSYENTYDKMFSLSYDGNTFSLSEVELPVPQTNISSNYKGLTTDVIPHLNDQDFIALVVCIDEKPVGWTFAHWKVRDAGKVLTIGGILVATEAHRKGCAKSLLHELLSIAQNTSYLRVSESVAIRPGS